MNGTKAEIEIKRFAKRVEYGRDWGDTEVRLYTEKMFLMSYYVTRVRKRGT